MMRSGSHQKILDYLQLIVNTFSEEDAERSSVSHWRKNPMMIVLYGSVNLRESTRKLVNIATCPRCGEEVEIIDHLFRECPVSVEGFRKWSYPPGASIKINFDGAYDVCHFQSASGIMAKNNERTVLLSCSEIHQEVASAFTAEALACRKAIIARSRNLEFVYTPISANILAHILATESLKKEEVYLVKNVPGYAENQKETDRVREPEKRK
ncbi:hypothetical protein Gogos_021457 [Gossypium gossypioides]|uniref:Reverse transcriptase zinc-binding domain-containing protein n=1 Tax=Gossypium gossypioides TaxID=34282 RepID=A0A7J9CXH5_GOSGO|nr:hypothetical protein [Gossypium gossypioides]